MEIEAGKQPRWPAGKKSPQANAIRNDLLTFARHAAHSQQQRQMGMSQA